MGKAEAHSPSLPQRIPEIDGLRGLAILAVIFHHYPLPPVPPGSALSYVFALFRSGWMGVDLFFVLSGFLIGGILLDAKGSPSYFKTFYVRRFCRILPLYLVVVALFRVVLCVPALAASPALAGQPPLWSCLTFTQNYWQTWQNPSSWMGAFGPTWSLCVEEHFYLTLPAMVWLLPRRPLACLLCALALLAPFFRGLSAGPHAYVLTHCRMDALCMGVLGAVLVRNPQGVRWLASQRRLLHGALLVLLLGTALVPRGSPMWLRGNHSLVAASSLCVVLAAVSYTDGVVAKAMRLAPLRRAGTLCFGLYLLHMPALRMAHGLAGAGDDPWRAEGLRGGVAAGGALLATFALASLSWRYFEAPFVRLGHRWTYGGAGRAAVKQATARLPGKVVAIGDPARGAAA